MTTTTTITIITKNKLRITIETEVIVKKMLENEQNFFNLCHY